MRLAQMAALLLVAAGLAGGAAAQETGRRMLGDDEAPAFRGVGRLNVAGRRFCTATLISDLMVVTAAHCLYHPRTGAAVPLSELRFVAGLRRGEVAALRGVAAVAVPPDFVFAEDLDLSGVRADIALVALDRPVGPEAPALAVGGRVPVGGAVAIVSYGRDRAQAASIQQGCAVRAAIGGVLALDCPVTFGASGAPVFATVDGARRLVGVVSAMGRLEAGGDMTFAVLLAPRRAGLEAALAAAAGAGR